MLEKLFGSATRVKILKLLLLHPDERHYIREIARGLRLQVNSVRRELENLENFGLLVSSIGHEDDDKEIEDANPFLNKTKKKNPSSVKISTQKSSKNKQDKKYYKANMDFVLYEEIRNLFMKAQILYGEDFMKKIQKAGKIKLLVLSGIFVNNLDSPVDLFIVGRFDKAKLLRLVKNLEKEIGKEINFSFMDYKEFKYRMEITDIFLYRIMEGKKIIAIDEVGLV